MIPSFTAFVASVLGLVLTGGQYVFCRVAYDGVDPADLSTDEQAIARELFGAVDRVPPLVRAVIVAVCGRRSGKSFALGALRLLWLALFVDLSPLAPGEVAYGIIVAPDLRLARQTLAFVRGAAKLVPQIANRISSETADGFVIARPDGRRVAIECLPASAGGSATRGRSLVGALLDEACFFKDSDHVVNDLEVFRSVRPAILPGGAVLILSSPWTEAGLVYDLWRTNHGVPVTALAARAPTLLMRDDPETVALVEQETALDPESAACEFGAEFRRGGGSAFFDYAAIQEGVARCSFDGVPVPAHAIKTAGGDLGLVSDSSALVVGARVPGMFAVVELLELRPEAGTPLKLSHVIGRFAEVLHRHGLSSFSADAHAREPAREWAALAGISVDAAPGGADAKVQGYTALRSAFNEAAIAIPNNPRLIAQLRAVTARPQAGGGLRIEVPRRRGNAHGDLVSALVLAHAGGTSPGARMLAALRSLDHRGGVDSLAAQLFGDPQGRNNPS